MNRTPDKYYTIPKTETVITACQLGDNFSFKLKRYRPLLMSHDAKGFKAFQLDSIGRQIGDAITFTWKESNV